MSAPDLFPMQGEWIDYLNKVYDLFLESIITYPKKLHGKQIRVRYNPSTDNKSFGFWHVISEGQTEEDRTPDLRRCERIRWIGWMLDRADQGDTHLRVLESKRTTKRGTVTRLVLWCEPTSYVVILEERGNYFFLITAYPIDGHRSRKLKAEWERSQK